MLKKQQQNSVFFKPNSFFLKRVHKCSKIYQELYTDVYFQTNDCYFSNNPQYWYIRVLLRIFNKETQFNLCNTKFQITMSVNVLVCVHTEYVSILMVATSVYATLVSHLPLMVEPVQVSKIKEFILMIFFFFSC